MHSITILYLYALQNYHLVLCFNPSFAATSRIHGPPVPEPYGGHGSIVQIASHCPSARLQLNFFKSAKLSTGCLSSFQFPKSCYYSLPIVCLSFIYIQVQYMEEHPFKTLLSSH